MEEPVATTTIAPVATEDANVGDLTIHYAETGAGHPLICLHGTGPGASGWASYRNNAPVFATAFRTLVPDLPRFGGSSKVSVAEPRLDFTSRAVRGFMDTLGIEKAHIVGNSMGAQTALKLAIDTPERVAKLVLMAPAVAGYSLTSPMPTEAVRLISEYYGGGGPSLEKMRTLLSRMVYDQSKLTDEMVLERYQASIDPETIRVNSDGHWARQSLEAELERCVTPTLLVWGHDDRATPLDMALLLMRKLRDVRLHVFARCGHWANVECADEFNQLVMSFLTV
jgi:4,5:9,10-diseco-3-hydroxy-5,9,17-trioxoandrosta-1(10),2-diene-4-oate hydrolase